MESSEFRVQCLGLGFRVHEGRGVGVWGLGFSVWGYRGTSLIRNRPSLGPA